MGVFPSGMIFFDQNEIFEVLFGGRLTTEGKGSNYRTISRDFKQWG